MNSTITKVCVVCGREFPASANRCPEDDVILSEGDPLVGTILDGKYQILSFIGVGGMSRVYKAAHIDLNRQIAIKFLKSSERIDLQRFRREAVSVNQLQHHNIARVYSFSVSTEGKPYLAMEYIEGHSLASIMADQSVPPARAIQLITQIAAGLSHAHGLGIVHRDIKPANVMLINDADDEVTAKIVDFGMARLSIESGAQKLTQTGEIFGTRQYISPEQYRGISADHRADVFSLGMLLFELVVREGKIPEPLRPVIDRALAAEPDERYQAMSVLQEDLSKATRMLDEKTRYVSISPDWADSKQSFWNWYLLSICIGLCCLVLAVLCMVRQVMHPNLLNTTTTSRSIKRTLVAVPVGYASLKIRTEQLISALRLNDAEYLCKLWSDHTLSDRILTPEEKAGVDSIRARIESARKNYAKAQPLWRTVSSYLEQDTDKNFAEIVEARTALAEDAAQLGQYEEARKTANTTIGLLQRKLGPDSSLELVQMIELGRIAEHSKRFQEAKRIYIAALQKVESGRDFKTRSFCEASLANFYAEQGEADNAELFYKRALDSLTICYTQPALMADMQASLGQVYLDANQYELASDTLERAWINYRKDNVLDQKVLRVVENLGRVYKLRGHLLKSKEMVAYGNELRKKLKEQGIALEPGPSTVP